jgi:hypothetical protein
MALTELERVRIDRAASAGQRRAERRAGKTNEPPGGLYPSGFFRTLASLDHGVRRIQFLQQQPISARSVANEADA